MFIGAILDAGHPIDRIRSELKKIAVLRCRIEVKKTSLSGIRATRFHVFAPKQGPERSWQEIRGLIEKSPLAPEIRRRGVEIFGRLAEAEAKIHGVKLDRVHFHEVGAVDSIVDIMATAIATHQLAIDAFYFSRVPLGRGLARTRHGALPIPGPATLELLTKIPVEWLPIAGETVTPTGAAIIATLGAGFGNAPAMTVERIGYGAGAAVFPDRPNLFRLALGYDGPAAGREEMTVMETNIDDMNPELYDYVLDLLFEAGARDVFLTPIQMKKNRPGVLLSILAPPAARDRLAETLFRETSTLGVRYHAVQRLVLRRETARLKTRYGTVKIKVIEAPDGAKRATPEYDDLKRIARGRKIPLKILYDEVARAFASSKAAGASSKNQPS
jgi:hypothetical protein